MAEEVEDLPRPRRHVSMKDDTGDLEVLKTAAAVGIQHTITPAVISIILEHWSARHYWCGIDTHEATRKLIKTHVRSVAPERSIR